MQVGETTDIAVRRFRLASSATMMVLGVAVLVLTVADVPLA